AMVDAHLAHTGQQDQLAAFTLMVTVIDQAHAGLASDVIDERTAKLAEASSRARGYLDGRSLAEVFAWLRPNDLIWNYWVNNYLLGKKPAPFDILFWNADTTRMTAGLHRDFLELGAANALVTPGTATMLGSPVDPQEWLRLAETCHGSWWPDYASWLAERCGEEKAAPLELGGGGLVPVSEAPGTYVYDH